MTEKVKTKTFEMTEAEFKEYLEDDLKRGRGAMQALYMKRSLWPFKLPDFIHGVAIWDNCSIHPLAEIGEGSIIGTGTNITGAVKIGKFVKIQSYVFIPEGVTIEDAVFIGPGVIFTNVKYPEVRKRDPKIYAKTVIRKGANIGAGAIIGPDVEIGEGATIGMGSVVTHDIAGGWLARGNPARLIRYLK